ncbi:mevalonate kinase [Microbacterium sp.]|uniref:mevalonate kinase n=1 Tax=Microbacterium sp. TaxID=51671 RepID=UPI003C72EA8B
MNRSFVVPRAVGAAPAVSDPSRHPVAPGGSAPARARARAEAPALGTAVGKAILLGEHSVVYGHPAIAIPLHGLGVRVEAERIPDAADTSSMLDSRLFTGPLDQAPERLRPAVEAIRAALNAVDADAAVRVHVRGDIPAERGLGSSAAVAAAIVTAVCAVFGRSLDEPERHELIQTAERAAHGTPSGLDAHTVVADGPIWFHGGIVERLAVAAPMTFVVADTGVAGGTRAAVTGVRSRREADPERIDALLAALGDLAETGRHALARGDSVHVGVAMTQAHELLGMLGVGHPQLDMLAAAALAAGAHGAKLTGGGLGGCVLVLARDTEHAVSVERGLREAGAAETWITTVEETP